MNIWLVLGIAYVVASLVFILSLCKVAGDADRAMERWHA